MSHSTPNKLTPTDRAMAIALKELGVHTHERIARAFGISETRLYQIMKEHREADPHDPYCRGL